MTVVSTVQFNRGMRPRLLDLFCKAGGAAKGYADAGFEVVGVDWEPQSRYPFEFIRADVRDLDASFLRLFDAIHASPPCQAHTMAQRIRKRSHPDLIHFTRERLSLFFTGPYVIENVPGAPLRNPVELCGCMFSGLNVYRERLFESNFPLAQPPHREHAEPLVKMGRPPKPGHRMHVVGNFSGVAAARKAMGIDWMVRDELREAIPPAYTEHIGAQLMTALDEEAA